MTSSPSRGEEDRERKTVCTHPSMSISNYSSTNHQRGSIGSGWAGWWWWGGCATEGWREQGRVWRCPLKDRRITDQYGRMDFVILKRAVRGWFTPTCSELYPPTQAVDDTSVHHVSCPILLRLCLVRYYHTVGKIISLEIVTLAKEQVLFSLGNLKQWSVSARM